MLSVRETAKKGKIILSYSPHLPLFVSSFNRGSVHLSCPGFPSSSQGDGREGGSAPAPQRLHPSEEDGTAGVRQHHAR